MLRLPLALLLPLPKPWDLPPPRECGGAIESATPLAICDAALAAVETAASAATEAPAARPAHRQTIRSASRWGTY